MTEPTYHDLTGGLEELGFETLYEVRGSGAFDYEIGDVLPLVISGGKEIKGTVCSVERSGAEWIVMLEEGGEWGV